MIPWSFKAYVTEDGRNLIQDWYAEQEVKVRAEFDVALATLRAIDDWLDDAVDEFKELKRDHAGLCEIRFFVREVNPDNGRPYRRKFRPPGIWRPEMRDFIILLGCEKPSRNTYIPHCAFDLALQYKSELEDGRGTICDYE